MYLTGTQRLTTDRLVLRRLTVDDAQQMYDNWASDPEVTTFLTWPTHSSVDVSRSVVGSWVESYDDPGTFNWGIELIEDGILIGQTSVVETKLSVGLVNVGYVIGRRWWGKGYCTEALIAVMDYLFSVAQANKVEASHDPANVASQRVMEKAGLVTEGLRRASCLSGSTIRDQLYHGILASEWKLHQRGSTSEHSAQQRSTI
ncbi:GNAT family N-acetyltransferase [Cutibacterium sp.]|uniref:GNAT family N-acetyltransferase n=1 Tax=Cutibacterium sp. TaxID=1912221 RepID=UPI0026DC1625|nr:GNAT family N-acetyltransferase [Cutibacterium sp.]MDO4411969.1 GNAT family N-acetyltransferase [Cutibacterium sp.]